MAQLKINRKLFDINDKDIVLFNGACWQLITRLIFSGWHSYYPTMSKLMCEKFVKKGILIMFKKTGEYLTVDGRQMGLYYYRFDMEKLNEYISMGG